MQSLGCVPVFVAGLDVGEKGLRFQYVAGKKCGRAKTEARLNSYSEAVPVDLWTRVEARVTECRYQFAGMGNMAFGFSTRKKFRIAFEYGVSGVEYAGAYQSATAVAQGTRVTVRYNPLRPEENSMDAHAVGGAADGRRGAGVGPAGLIGFGLMGSVVLSLMWLAVLRGCR